MTLTREVLDTFADQLPEIRATLTAQIEEDIEALDAPVETGDALFDDLMAKVYALMVKNISAKRIRTINRITAYLDAKRNPRLARGRITDEMIARAKEHPIAELYEGTLRRGAGLCPFHNEKTPSFHIKDNRFRCYGCGEWGDTIAFLMKRDGLSFTQAVRKLI